jgi:hypothetical protein
LWFYQKEAVMVTRARFIILMGMLLAALTGACKGADWGYNPQADANNTETAVDASQDAAADIQLPPDVMSCAADLCPPAFRPEPSDRCRCVSRCVTCPSGTACEANPAGEWACRSTRATCAVGQLDCTPTAPAPTCVNAQSDVTNCGACGNVCSLANANATCVAGACRIATCVGGFVNCDGDMTNGCEANLNSAAHCGRCGNACPVGTVCANGACSSSCPSGQTICGTACATLASDLNNCGACGNACPIRANATSACVAGTCQQLCNTGFANCDGDWSNGCEVNLASNSNHCGSCGNACTLANANGVCIAGSCRVASCIGGFDNCDGNVSNGCEANLNSAAHCGACGRICAAGQTCQGGTCSSSCSSGQTMCGTTCANLQTNLTNCGICGNVCPTRPNAAPMCTAGACGYNCLPGFSNCDGDWMNGCEVNLASNSNHCGSCGIRCNNTNGASACVAGTCQVTACNTGFDNCDRDPSNGCEANLSAAGNCGACGRTCGAGSVCNAGRCDFTCTGGLTACGAVCIDTQSDVANCGACGNVCGRAGGPFDLPNVYPTCTNGACGTACNPGFGNCNSLTADGCEVSLQSDAMNCGACANACPTRPNAVPSCVAGACRVGTCNQGFANCNGFDFDGCERDLRNDREHCGACGRRCADSQVCRNGACDGPVCPPGEVQCAAFDGLRYCADFGRDVNNCGGCNNRCVAGPHSTAVCASTFCRLTCDTGYGDCDFAAWNGCERNLQSDTAHCGACGRACAAGQICTAGTCTTPLITCGAGQIACGGVCVNSQTDNTNCGACGRVCATGQTCSAGNCASVMTMCSGTQIMCAGGVCRDLQTDSNNCGSCGTVCPSGTVCGMGRCAAVITCGTTGRAFVYRPPTNFQSRMTPPCAEALTPVLWTSLVAPLPAVPGVSARTTSNGSYEYRGGPGSTMTFPDTSALPAGAELVFSAVCAADGRWAESRGQNLWAPFANAGAAGSGVIVTWGGVNQADTATIVQRPFAEGAQPATIVPACRAM